MLNGLKTIVKNLYQGKKAIMEESIQSGIQQKKILRMTLKPKIVDHTNNNRVDDENKFNVINNKIPLNQRILKSIRNHSRGFWKD